MRLSTSGELKEEGGRDPLVTAERFSGYRDGVTSPTLRSTLTMLFLTTRDTRRTPPPLRFQRRVSRNTLFLLPATRRKTISHDTSEFRRIYNLSLGSISNESVLYKRRCVRKRIENTFRKNRCSRIFERGQTEWKTMPVA